LAIGFAETLVAHFWYTTRQLHEFFFNGKALQQKAEISGSRGVRL